MCTDSEYTAGVLVIVFFGIIMGAFGLGNSFPNLANFATARGAAKGIFDVIDRVSLLRISNIAHCIILQCVHMHTVFL